MRTGATGIAELHRAQEVELVEELSTLTTEAARMRARMADIMAELDRRRQRASAGPARSAAGSW